MSPKILIVGGVAGGASFAARMRRLDEHAEIIMFEKGEFVSFANCGLPYYLGETIKERSSLIIQTPGSLRSRFNVDVRTNTEVVSVDPAAKSITVRTKSGVPSVEKYDYLILSPGAKPIQPPLPGIDMPNVFTIRTIPDIDRIKSYVDKEKPARATVVGGGFIGLEMAENLHRRGVEVTLVELLDQVFPPADYEMARILHQHLELNGVRVMLKDGLQEIQKSGEGMDVVLTSGARFRTDLVVLAIGVSPDTGFLSSSGVQLNERGAVVVDDHMRTNLPDVFAVGDAIEVTDFVSGSRVSVPLAGPANRQARIAADNVAGIESTYKHTQGTAICKVFDLAAAVTGINERTALRLKIPFVKSYTHSSSHAGYYPGAFPLSLKILFDPATGRLLGAQVVGTDGVDTRIDVLATAIRHHLTVQDLSELELAYAPPYGSAKDAVNIAGFVAENILTKRASVFYAEDVAGIDLRTQILLDVRSPAEVKNGALPGAVNIPVDSLRARLADIDKDKEIMVYCQVGLRGYLAARVLMQHGFRVRNLSGGYKTYLWAQVSG